MSPTLPAAYTPLESLLLFQALRADGFDSLSFQKISRDLQGIPLVTKDKSYDPARLDPDALKDLYLGLLKEEVKRDLDNAPQTNGDHATTNGDTSPGSRKRKVSSPTLPTVRDAAQHAHLIPQLVMRLYARYRENAMLLNLRLPPTTVPARLDRPLDPTRQRRRNLNRNVTPRPRLTPS